MVIGSGDEFAVMLTQAGRETVEKLVRLITQAVAEAKKCLPGVPLGISLNAGAVKNGRRPLVNVNEATDTAMYRDRQYRKDDYKGKRR